MWSAATFGSVPDFAEEAMEFGERLNDPGILMEALFLRGLTMLYRGDFFGAHEWLGPLDREIR